MKSFGLDLSFPSEIFEFVTVEKSGLSKEFDQLDANEIATSIKTAKTLTSSIFLFIFSLPVIKICLSI